MPATILISGGDDVTDGGDGGGVLYGDTYQANLYDYSGGMTTNPETVSITGGSDTVTGGTDNDTIYGDFLFAQATSYIAAAVARIVAGDDIIEGGAGNDTLWGDFGNSSLGGGGNRTITTGDDIFVFNPGSGNDNIRNFQHGAGATGDRLDVSGYGYTSFGELNIGNSTPTQAYVDFGGGNIVNL